MEVEMDDEEREDDTRDRREGAGVESTQEGAVDEEARRSPTNPPLEDRGRTPSRKDVTEDEEGERPMSEDILEFLRDFAKPFIPRLQFFWVHLAYFLIVIFTGKRETKSPHLAD